MKIKDMVAIFALFIVSFYIWTIPLQGQEFPFGEGDAAHQFGTAEGILHFDDVGFKNPFFMAAWYPFYSGDFFTTINAPYFMINSAVMQIIGGERFLPVGVYYAVVCNFLLVLGIYFIIRRLYGFNYAFLSAFFLIFPMRNVLSYVWGQRTILMALAYIPVVLYAYYKYIVSYLENREKPIYLYIIALLSGFAGFFHPAALLNLFFAMGVFTVVIGFKEKKIPFNFKSIIFPVIIFILIFAPFVPAYIGSKIQGDNSFDMKINDLGSLFSWVGPGTEEGNELLYDFSKMNGGYWTILFIWLGIIFLLLRWKTSDILLISWLVGLYLLLHLGVFNLDILGVDRALKGSSHIFYPLVVIGILGIFSLIKIPSVPKRYIQYALIFGLLFIVIMFNAKPVISVLKDSYSPILRITPYQYEAIQWIDENIPEDAIVYSIGSLTYPKMRWIHVLSHKAMMPGIYQSFEEAQENVKDFPVQNKITHVLIDYSDYALLRNQEQIDVLLQFEENYVKNEALVYNKDNIRVYEINED